MSIIFSIWTIIVLILFVGITVWVWSNKNKDTFDTAAHIPFDEDDSMVPGEKKEEITDA